MLTMLRKRLAHDDERGFTLIELMVVVLIIAILIAIAIPTFLGARDRANKRAAQSNLRNALTAEKTVYADSQVYVGPTDTKLTNSETNLKFTGTVADATAKTNTVYVAVANSDRAVTLSTMAEDGTCYHVRDNAVSAASPWNFTGTQYGTSTACATAPTNWNANASSGGW